MLKKIFPNSDMFKNISTLVVGTFLAQLIPVLLQAVLRRMYPAEDFGSYAVFISITGIFMVIAALRFEMAVVLPEKKHDAINLVFTGIFSSLIFSLLILLVIFAFQDPILSFLNLRARDSFMLYYLPLAIFLFSCYQVINYYLVRQKAYKAISINKISRRLSEGLLQTLLGHTGKFSVGLIWGNIAGHFVNVVAGVIQMLRNGFILRCFSFRRQWELFKRYREFPVYNMIPALLNAICMHLPLILINKFFARETAAYFDLARQVLILPASILALSISQVLLQSISEKNHQKKSIRADIFRLLWSLSALAACMIVVVMLWAPGLFSLYAGAEYHVSGVYAQILVAGAAIKLVVSPLSSIFAALKKIKIVSIWQAIYFLMICSLFLFPEMGIMHFLKLYLLIDLFAYGWLLFLILWHQNKYEKKLSATQTNSP